MNSSLKIQKIVIGFSDITALLLAIHTKTGLVTFHGPMGIMPWPQFSVEAMTDILFNANTPTLANPQYPLNLEKDIIQTKDRIEVIKGGKATGELIGGSLSILVTLLGTPYEPDWEGKILFLEDVGENFYAIDRMMSSLELAGVLKKIKGFVFGKCTRCKVAKRAYGTFTLSQILNHYIKPLGIPAFSGSMIGHEPMMFTLPQGVRATIDGDLGTITLLDPSVK